MKLLRLLFAVILVNLLVSLDADAVPNDSPVRIRKEIKKGRLRFSSHCKQDRNLTISLFDMHGKLVRQVLVRTNQTSSFSEISRGNYFFEIFSNDQRIENGSITVP